MFSLIGELAQAIRSFRGPRPARAQSALSGRVAPSYPVRRDQRTNEGSMAGIDTGYPREDQDLIQTVVSGQRFDAAVSTVTRDAEAGLTSVKTELDGSRAVGQVIAVTLEASQFKDEVRRYRIAHAASGVDAQVNAILNLRRGNDADAVVVHINSVSNVVELLTTRDTPAPPQLAMQLTVRAQVPGRHVPVPVV